MMASLSTVSHATSPSSRFFSNLELAQITLVLFFSSFAIFTLLLSLRSVCEIYDQYRHHNDNTVGQLAMLGRSNASFVAVFRSQVMVLI